MLQLVLHVCLQNAPAICHFEYLNSTAPSMSQCVGDQISLAKWAGDHPQFRIAEWHCNADGKREADL